VEIFSVEGIVAAAAAPPPGRPAYLVPFAGDGAGNHWCFDLRPHEGDEASIVFWDHEEPPAAAELAEAGAPTSFDDWLEGLVSTHVAEDASTAFAERLKRIEDAITPHRGPNVRPHPPTREDVTAVEATLRFTLPKDYVGFTTQLGSTTWPLEIVDAQELEKLTEVLRTRFGSKARGVVAFGREAEGAILAFERRGKLVAFGGYPVEDATFLDFLERRIRERGGAASLGDAPAVAGPPSSDVPYGIVEDEWVNSVWRAVAKASRHTTAPTPDGRIEVSVEDYQGGKRRMFVDAPTWRTIEEHLAKLHKA
jgi:cell wall assembly regulator SMI1